jgi:hypothetical protein
LELKARRTFQNDEAVEDSTAEDKKMFRVVTTRQPSGKK